MELKGTQMVPTLGVRKMRRAEFLLASSFAPPKGAQKAPKMVPKGTKNCHKGHRDKLLGSKPLWMRSLSARPESFGRLQSWANLSSLFAVV